MKNLFIHFFVLLFLIIATGCEEENDQLNPTSLKQEENCTESTVDILDFEFCLYNSNNVPSSTFKKGDNFIFGLNLTNISSDTITVRPDFIDNSFYLVKNKTGEEIFGKPYTSVWCEYSLAPQLFIINPGESFSINCPWTLENGIWPDKPLCKGEDNEHLPKGTYYTGMNMDFSLVKDGKITSFDGPTAKINFKIE